MRILVIGSEGDVGKAAITALSSRHEIVTAGRSTGQHRVDVTDEASVVKLYEATGTVDAVVTCTGHTHFGPLQTMTPAQFLGGLEDKLMGQVNAVLLGLKHVRDGGSFTLTSGVLSIDPIRQGANASSANGALEKFVMAAAIEMPRGQRINVVSPGLLEESAARYDGFFPGHLPVSSARVGLAYAKSVEGAGTGQVITVL